MLARLDLVSIAMALGCMLVHAAQATLTPAETAKWMAVGQRCEAPVTRIRGRDGTSEIYVESPAARAAVVAATATIKHVPLAAAGVKSALKSGYRIWVVNTS